MRNGVELETLDRIDESMNGGDPLMTAIAKFATVDLQQMVVTKSEGMKELLLKVDVMSPEMQFVSSAEGTVTPLRE